MSTSDTGVPVSAAAVTRRKLAAAAVVQNSLIKVDPEVPQ